MLGASHAPRWAKGSGMLFAFLAASVRRMLSRPSTSFLSVEPCHACNEASSVLTMAACSRRVICMDAVNSRTTEELRAALMATPGLLMLKAAAHHKILGDGLPSSIVNLDSGTLWGSQRGRLAGGKPCL